MKRREFIKLLSAATAAWPPAASAQQRVGAAFQIAIVAPVDIRDTIVYAALIREMRSLGYIDGQNLTIRFFSGEGQIANYEHVAQEVVRMKPDLIVAFSNGIARRLMERTKAIPIIGFVSDPVTYKLVSNLARPGGNLTGVSSDAGYEVWGKRLQLVKELVPTAERIGYLGGRERYGILGSEIQRVTEQTRTSLIWPPIENFDQASEYHRIFSALREERADALILIDRPEHWPHRQLILRLAAEVSLPTLYPNRPYVTIGGLMAHYHDPAEISRHAATQIDRIFRGARPDDIPVYQPVDYKLSINLKTAKALRLEVPTSILIRADEVIE